MESIPGCHFYSNNRRNRITIEYFDLREEVLLGKSQVQYVFSRFHEIQIPTKRSGQAWLPLPYVKVRTVKYETVCRSKLNKIPIFDFPSEGKLASPLVTAVLFFAELSQSHARINLPAMAAASTFQGLTKSLFLLFAVRNV